jgi:cobalt/nickel transport system permease protein
MILAILLGPYAAFLTIASVVTVQALFFADGGLLALGCNIFNMGFFPCFVAYPFVYRKIVGERATQGRILAGSIFSAVLGLQMGAFSVVVETLCSRISELPFGVFLVLMQPIHLAIGFVEGLVTSAVVSTVWKARPELVDKAAGSKAIGNLPIKTVLVGLVLVTVLTAGVFSWFASTSPDGLEWSMRRTSGKEELQIPESTVHTAVEKIQQKTAVFPDYDFKKPDRREEPGKEPEQTSSVVHVGTSIAGLVGAVLTLVLVGILGVALRRRVNRKSKP